MTSFLNLPNELLQNVACRLPFSALINLQCANRRLYGVCRDHFVLQSVVHYGFDNTPDAVDSLIRTHSASNRIPLEPQQLEWKEADSLLENSDLEKIRRVAYTVDRCIAFAMAHGRDEVGTLCEAPPKASSYVFDFLPAFLALHHPAALALDASHCLFHAHREASNQLVEGSADEKCLSSVIDLGFIIAYLTLQRFSTTYDYTETMRLFEEFFAPRRWATSPEKHRSDFDDDNEIYGLTFTGLSKLIPHYGEQQNPFPLVGASKVTLVLIYGLVHAPLFVESAPQLLVPSKIPFRNFMDLESIFDVSPASFDTCHILGMISPEFLSSGIWTGYYTDERLHDYRGIEATLFDPPMFDINIVARELSPHDATARGARTKIDRQTKGTDSHGDFRLEGRVYENGTVDIVKSYLVGDTSWVWTGHVTPLGIVGHWGDQWQFGGYFWIWKEEWM